jgi:hypothetical protein
MTDKKQEYEVGYGKPPRHTQFKKGRSGNPAGRAKGSRNLATLLGRTLKERVVVNENGRRRSITKLEAAVKQLVNKAASGDAKFMVQLLSLVKLVEERADPQAAAPTLFTDADRQILSGVAERLAAVEQENENG